VTAIGGVRCNVVCASCFPRIHTSNVVCVAHHRYGAKFDVVGDELNGREIAQKFTKARRDPWGRGRDTRGPRRLRFVKDMPPCGRTVRELTACIDCTGGPAASQPVSQSLTHSLSHSLTHSLARQQAWSV
jgi:hypothetical protein